MIGSSLSGPGGQPEAGGVCPACRISESGPLPVAIVACLRGEPPGRLGPSLGAGRLGCQWLRRTSGPGPAES